MSDDFKVAIIGIACRFSHISTPAEFLHSLSNSVDLSRPRSASENPAAVVNSQRRSVRYTIDADPFDADFFDYTQNQANVIDPQQKVFLECSVEALNAASIDPDRSRGRIGVFAGSGTNFWLLDSLARSAKKYTGEELVALQFGNDKDYLASRTSFKLNLRGPSIGIQTACSSSLVAIHLACQSIIVGECDAALAGGVNLTSLDGYSLVEGGLTSPDGICRPFDKDANGAVWGDGVGVVVLKRLDDAIAEKHNIVAIISGSAVNNDGFEKASFTAPSVDGQVDVIKLAQAVAEVTPLDITYVEAHGTGTRLGDPIEMKALEIAFDGLPSGKYCAVGSVKSNIGHVGAAAGVAGLIKAALSLQEKKLFPTLHFQTPNEEIDFAKTPFFVNSTYQDWRAGEGQIRRAGVSSFGIGGTNAHVILEEAPSVMETASSRRDELIILSAKSPEAVRELQRKISIHLSETHLSLTDVAFSLAIGRKQYRFRCAFVVNHDSANWMADLSPDIFENPLEEPDLAITISNEDIISPEVIRDLSLSEPIFEQAVEECIALLEHRSVPAPTLSLAAALESPSPVNSDVLRFAFSYALVRLLSSWGIKSSKFIATGPDYFIAAALTGQMNLSEAFHSFMACSDRNTLEASHHPDCLHGIKQATPGATARSIQSCFSPRKGMRTALIWIGGLPTNLDKSVRDENVIFDIALLPPMRDGGTVRALLLESLGRLWAVGCSVDWDAFYATRDVKRVCLPAYPFRRTFSASSGSPQRSSGHESLSHEQPNADHFALAIKRIWGRAFEPVEVNSDDDFFELNGDSLLAAQMVGAINKLFNLNYPSTEIFNASTLAAFTESIRSYGSPTELHLAAELFLTIEDNADNRAAI